MFFKKKVNTVMSVLIIFALILSFFPWQSALGIVDLSTASAALETAGSKNAGATFNIAVSGAKDVSGSALNGSVAVTVTNGAAGTIYNGTPTFTAGADGGSATVVIPANTASLTTAGTYNLTVSITGITPTPTVPVTIIAATAVESNNSTAVIDQPLAPGASRTITVTLRDTYGNLMTNVSKNMKIIATVTNSNATTAEHYTVDGTDATATITLSRSRTTDAEGQYAFNVTMPADIDPGDGVTIQVSQNDISKLIGSAFTYSAMAAPVLSTAVTTSEGNKIILTFSKTMADPSGQQGQFTVHVGAGTIAVSSVALNGTSAAKIELSLASAITFGQTVTLDYTPGTMTSSEGGILASISGRAVINDASDLSTTSAALETVGSKNAGTAFNIAVSGAKDVSGSALSGSVAVTVTNGAAGTIYNGTPTFTAGADGGSATVVIPANTASLTTAGTYNLTVSIAGITPTPTVPVTIIAATAVESNNSTAVIDQPLTPGASRTVTVTLRDTYGNLMTNVSKNMKIIVAVDSNDATTAEHYTVDGTDVTALITLSRSRTTDAGGQYAFNVTMPADIDTGDGVAIQVSQNDTAKLIGSAFTYNAMPAPVLNTAATTSDGSKIILTFSKTMADPSGQQGQFTVHLGAGTIAVSSAALNGSDAAKIELTLASAITNGQSITLDYTKGTVTSADNGVLAGFTGQIVTNNVPAGSGQPLTLAAVTTGTPSGTGANKDAATFTGSVTSDTPVTECGIIYSASPIPVVTNLANIVGTKVAATTPGTGAFTVTVDLSALSDGKYYTRAYAVNSAGLAMGDQVDYAVGISLFLMDATLNNGVSLVNNHSVPPGSYTVDIEISKNISSDSVLANNKTCFSLKDLTSNSYIPITVDRIGTGTEDLYKDHLYFDVTLVNGHSYQITISGNLTANNLNTLQNPITISFTSFDSGSGSTNSTTGPKQSDTPLVTSQISVSTGGTVQATDGTKVVIPAGAIPAGASGSLEIAIYKDTTSINPTIPGITAYNQEYTERSFGPSGTQFNTPVTLIIPFELANIPATDYPYLSVYLWQNGRWVKIGGVVDPVTKTVSVTVNHFSTYRIMADKTTTSVRTGGTDRYDTAVKIAQSNFATGADTVILARGDASADSLTAVPLAKYFSAPLLLTPQSYLPTAVLNEIKTLKAKKVYIIGGEQVVSAKVAQAIAAQGITVQRVAGTDRYGTAYEVAKLMGNAGQAVIVNGSNNAYADALSISSWAVYNGVPILYASGTNTLPTVTAQALKDLKVTRTILIGGTGVLPAALEQLVPNPERYAGSDRYGTNYAVLSKLQAKTTKIYAVTGANFADALAGAAVAGQYNAWILLTGNSPSSQNGLNPEQTQMVKDSKGTVLDLHIFGGTTAVPENVVTELQADLGL